MKSFFTFILIFFFSLIGFSQTSDKNLELRTNFLTPSENFNKNRTIGVSATAATLYGTSLIMLNKYWYQDFPRSSFQTFDDSDEWKGIDKFGHSYTAYFQGAWGYKLFRWSGVNHKKATLIGGSIGFINQTIIEILDGHSEQWGWSNYDLLANTTGTALFIAQNLTFKEQRFMLKFGSSPINYEKRFNNNSDINNAVNKWFGKSGAERIVKDYNAQTYWFTANIGSFLRKESKFPKWINIALGTGAEQMFHSTENSNQGINNLDPYRQYYLSADIDFTKIKTNNSFLKTFFYVLNVFKMPFPALEINKVDGAKFVPLAF